MNTFHLFVYTQGGSFNATVNDFYNNLTSSTNQYISDEVSATPYLTNGLTLNGPIEYDKVCINNTSTSEPICYMS